MTTLSKSTATSEELQQKELLLQTKIFKPIQAMVKDKVREFEQKISSGQDITAVCLDEIITTQIDEPS